MEQEQEILWRSPHCCEDGIAIPASERVEVHAAPHHVSNVNEKGTCRSSNVEAFIGIQLRSVAGESLEVNSTFASPAR